MYSDEFLEHLERTAITSTGSYVGKEHFLAMGDALGHRSNGMSMLFGVLVYPCLESMQPVEPESLGLVVGQREDIGLPVPPEQYVNHINVGDKYVSQIKQIHGSHGFSDPIHKVIQVGSILDFEANAEKPKLYSLAKRGLESLGLIAAQLRSQIG